MRAQQQRIECAGGTVEFRAGQGGEGSRIDKKDGFHDCLSMTDEGMCFDFIDGFVAVEVVNGACGKLVKN